MTQGRQRLELCRETLVAIRRQPDGHCVPDSACAAHTGGRAGHCRPAAAEPESAGGDPPTVAGAAGHGHAGAGRDAGHGIQVPMVLLRAGIINREVSQRLKYDCREVVRRKTEGLARLEEGEEKRC